MPSFELFHEQSLEYKLSVFPNGVPVVSVEAASTFGWNTVAHASCGIDRFGASAPAKDVYKYLGLVPEVVADKARKVVEFYKGKEVVSRVVSPF